MPIPYASLVLAFIVAVYLLHTYLDLRQYKAIRKPHLSESLAAIFSKETFQKSRAYSTDKWWYNLFYSFVSLLQTCVVLYGEWLPLLWQMTTSRMAHLPTAFSGEITCTVVFAGVLGLISSLLDIPWSLYKTFILEEKHGFNKQTIGSFISDILTTWMLGVIFLPPIVGGLTWILLHSNEWLPIYLWLFGLALSLFMMTIYPIAIAPLFNKFDPLENGSLRSKIEGLASQLGFPLKRLYKMDGSKRSAHSNAYMYGLFNNKRIVLFDTLLQQCTENEVTAVLAHELGHWKMSHNLYNFVSMQFVLLTQFLLFSFVRTSDDLFRSFGFVNDQPAFISFVLFSFISTPMNEIVELMQNVMSRRFEFQADRFAVDLGMGSELKAALIALENSNKGSLNVDPWYSAYHYSHPPMPERLNAIDKGLGKML